ncbi:hypothetical protein SAMD00023353_0201200 [Rosellinia necatrix]|uniref:Secreted protein n=1 Tax=Rosellinia necatrix TaxID=77044 RepID=A0A1S8A4W7_ROSNE|nr:hypothetical protein SAMD00023353_0201200 [Rosellinia necatrix]
MERDPLRFPLFSSLLLLLLPGTYEKQADRQTRALIKEDVCMLVFPFNGPAIVSRTHPNRNPAQQPSGPPNLMW